MLLVYKVLWNTKTLGKKKVKDTATWKTLDLRSWYNLWKKCYSWKGSRMEMVDCIPFSSKIWMNETLRSNQWCACEKQDQPHTLTHSLVVSLLQCEEPVCWDWGHWKFQEGMRSSVTFQSSSFKSHLKLSTEFALESLLTFDECWNRRRAVSQRLFSSF